MNDLNIKINGSGKIRLVLNAKSITSNVSGYGMIELEGSVDEEDIQINGTGNYNTFGLLSQKARVIIKGAGNCRINVMQELDVKIYGGGIVEYRGEPVVTTKSFGPGMVKAVK